MIVGCALAILVISGSRFPLAAVFIVLAIVPISIPVLTLVVKGDEAAPTLESLRRWIVKNNGTMSAVFMAVIAFIQIQKALAVLS